MAGHKVHNEVASQPDLEIPATFSVPHKSFLQSPTEEFRANFRYARDLLTNIIGFVPLGLIVCAYFVWTRNRWKAILIATLACGMFSFLIEVLQYYIPRRGSGITDIITNTLGAALGAALMRARPVRRILGDLKLIPSGQ
jgi:VanZ family protein